MPAAEDKIRFSELAEELGLTDDEANDFIGTAMLKKGYKAVTDWMDPEPETSTETVSLFKRPATSSGGAAPVKRTTPAATPPKTAGGQYS